MKINHIALALTLFQLASCLRSRFDPIPTGNQLSQLCQSNDSIFASNGAYLTPLLVPRPSNSSGNTKVQLFLVDFFTKLGWQVETTTFVADTIPQVGPLRFTNIIATFDTGAPRKLVLSAHFDSKRTPDGFIGATDSAGPCAVLLDLATSLTPLMQAATRKAQQGTSLQLVFFDGEEDIDEKWTKSNTYGSRYLANLWENTTPVMDIGRSRMFSVFQPKNIIEQVDLLVLLDLLGNADSTQIRKFPKVSTLYDQLAKIEKVLLDSGKLSEFRMTNRKAYFPGTPAMQAVQDDQTPFEALNVPILHLIPVDFPPVWHQLKDNGDNLSAEILHDFSNILRVFVYQYLNLQS